jgi:UDP-N-acetylglucosamine 4,6-dehydratase/5-epimerase
MTGLSGAVLITGGTGTLGNAIVRAAQSWDCSITIYSRSELKQAEMRAKYPRLRYVLGDVRDYERLSAAVAGHDIVVHAAAVKRIPEAEQQPQNCYETNIGGSANVVRACRIQGARRCIGISTDKACASLTAYGASKLAMEKLFQAQPTGRTAFTCVRYGNVVASNGSVIPMWRLAAAQGREIIITDNRMTRFWMAPSEAVDLVVRASATSHATILVPKMGALALPDMAHIVAPGARMMVSGLRSAEKLHEDLVHPDEKADDLGAHYLLGSGTTGHRYTSETAPRLTETAFLAMLEEAESYD